MGTTVPDDRTATWSADVRAAIRRVAGPWVDSAEQEWDRHAGTELVHVTVHGAYNAGKSSLLKRILAEDDTPCPPWLVIGARPTTFEVQRVESGGLVWIDTPGTGTGDQRHDWMADEALVLTDAVLVVLNPQLLDGDVRQVLGLLDSTFYTPLAGRSLFPAGSLVLAVGLMDAAGVAPGDDLDGYRALVARKADELRGALDAEAAAPERPALHLVAADPRQVGRRAQPTAADFAGSREWDGVANLRRDLQSLRGRVGELRAAARIRFWSRMAEQARESAADEAEQLGGVLTEAERQRVRVRLWIHELDSIDRDARGQLEERLYRDLSTASIHVADTDAGRTLLEERVDKTVGDWTDEFAAHLDRLVAAASTEQQVQLERPGAGALRRYLDDLVSTRAVPDDEQADRVHRLVKRFDSHAKAIARGGYKLLHGLSAEEARAELAHLRDLDATDLARYYARPDTPFPGADRAEAAKAGLELASAVADDIRSRRAEEQRLRLRTEVRAQAERIAERVLGGGEELTAWTDAVASLRKGFESLAPDETTVAEATARREVLDQVVGGLAALLADPPAPGGPAATGQ
jgi:hypothetical protein